MVVGAIAFTRLPLRELPNIDPPVVSIDVAYPGAAAGVVIVFHTFQAMIPAPVKNIAPPSTARCGSCSR